MVLQRSHGSPVQLPPLTGLTAANSGSPGGLGRTVDDSLFGGLVSVSCSPLLLHSALTLFGPRRCLAARPRAVLTGAMRWPPWPMTAQMCHLDQGRSQQRQTWTPAGPHAAPATPPPPMSAGAGVDASLSNEEGSKPRMEPNYPFPSIHRPPASPEPSLLSPNYAASAYTYSRTAASPVAFPILGFIHVSQYSHRLMLNTPSILRRKFSDWGGLS
ncbi:hypothetical protein MAPG_04261 [Magnaporthiopsis poae ATCC 64411]|uniref:Uncharacterized protein n=1 Tax=Magnaporthiopsis poae (strain ATCC 64411 / 73-15) TaxID=644358 RepID=A0A0C4DW87_MAGP6|nr:hypothetical protein MAPG_04261 [Magnaporthiopsis poae ATCC 64411]